MKKREREREMNTAAKVTNWKVIICHLVSTVHLRTDNIQWWCGSEVDLSPPSAETNLHGIFYKDIKASPCHTQHPPPTTTPLITTRHVADVCQ